MDHARNIRKMKNARGKDRTPALAPCNALTPFVLTTGPFCSFVHINKTKHYNMKIRQMLSCQRAPFSGSPAFQMIQSHAEREREHPFESNQWDDG